MGGKESKAIKQYTPLTKKIEVWTTLEIFVVSYCPYLHEFGLFNCMMIQAKQTTNNSQLKSPIYQELKIFKKLIFSKGLFIYLMIQGGGGGSQAKYHSLSLYITLPRNKEIQ